MPSAILSCRALVVKWAMVFGQQALVCRGQWSRALTREPCATAVDAGPPEPTDPTIPERPCGEIRRVVQSSLDTSRDRAYIVLN